MTREEEHALFLHHLGGAFAAWANVENAIRNCVVACFDEDDRPSLSLGFFSIENFRSKLAFADRVIHKKLQGKPFARDWSKLVGRARTASNERNALAHRSIVTLDSARIGRRIVLAPWIFPKPKKSAKRPRVPPGSFGVIEIVRRQYVFYALSASLMNFCHRVLGVKEQYPKDHEQVKNPPTIQILMRLMHEGLGHQQKSSREKRREEDARNAAASLLIPLPEKNS